MLASSRRQCTAPKGSARRWQVVAEQQQPGRHSDRGAVMQLKCTQQHSTSSGASLTLV